MTATIHRPEGEIGQAPATLAASPATLAGLRIAVLDNGKPNAALVMTRVAETIAARTKASVSLVIKKHRVSANAAIPAADDVMAEVLETADLVVTGTADCGSCTAYSVFDAIELEKAGRPAVVVTTTEFDPIARTMGQHFGLPAVRRLVLPHPIGGTDADTLHRWADAAADTAIALFTGRA